MEQELAQLKELEFGLQQSKDLEKKTKGLEVDLAEIQENLVASDRKRLTAETEQDKLTKELGGTSSKGALVIAKKIHLDTRIAALE